MLTFIKFCFIFIVSFAEVMVIDNVILKMDSKVDRVCFTTISVLAAAIIIAIGYSIGENYIPFGQ